MAVLTAQSMSPIGGRVLAFAAASAGGDRTAPGTGVFLLVRNQSAAAITVTLDATGKAFNGQSIPDTAVSVAAGAYVVIPVTVDYQSPVDSLAGIAYSAVTSVTVAVLTH